MSGGSALVVTVCFVLFCNRCRSKGATSRSRRCRACWWATAIRSTHPALAPGVTAVGVGEASWWHGIPLAARGATASAAAEKVAAGESGFVSLAVEGAEVSLLCARLEPPPHILVLGAGLDAEAVVRLAGELGWCVTIQDHRRAYIEKGTLQPPTRCSTSRRTKSARLSNGAGTGP